MDKREAAKRLRDIKRNGINFCGVVVETEVAEMAAAALEREAQVSSGDRVAALMVLLQELREIGVYCHGNLEVQLRFETPDGFDATIGIADDEEIAEAFKSLKAKKEATDGQA